MFGRRTLVPCQSGTRNGLSRRDAFAVIPASVESVQIQPHATALSVEEITSDRAVL